MDELHSVLDRSAYPQYYYTQKQPKGHVLGFDALRYNESVKIRMKHKSYSWSLWDHEKSVITFDFLDDDKNLIFQFKVIPGESKYILRCASTDAHVSAVFTNNAYARNYYFVIIFAKIGIMLFDNEFLVATITDCVHQIPTITKFTHTETNTEGFEATLAVQPISAIIGINHRVINPFKLIHYRCFINYYAEKNSTVVVRLADQNGIIGLEVTVNYKSGILYAKRNGLDDENIFCTNFTHSQQYSSRMLGQVEIGVYPFEYRIMMKINENTQPITISGCDLEGHHVSPYDIQQLIFDSPTDSVVFYSYYIQRDHHL